MYNPEENELLHELDEVRQELRRTKKALELACEDVMHIEMGRWCSCICDKCKFYPNECVNHKTAHISRYMKKAGEDNDT